MTDGPECCGCNYGERPCNCDCHLGDDTSVTDSISADIARPMTVAEAAKVLETDLDQLMSLIAAMPIGRHRREALAKVTEIRALSHEGGGSDV